MRQNTPHPRELKAKAHKLFSKGQNSLEESDLQQQQHHQESIPDAVNQYVKKPAPLVQPELETVMNNGAEESSEPSQEDDSDDVS